MGTVVSVSSRPATGRLSAGLEPVLGIGLFLLLTLMPRTSEGETVGQRNHGSGGPLVGATLFRTDAPGGRQVVTFSSGGEGYSYHLGGRLRLGGGGQGSFISTRDGEYVGRLSWGGLLVGYGLVQTERWELPLVLYLGGGGFSVERRLGRSGAAETVERVEGSFFLLQIHTGVEFLALRTFKLCLHVGYLVGLSSGVRLHGPRVALQISFMIPRRGR